MRSARVARPPRVCVVNASLPPAYGGAEIAAYRYAERYADAGGNVLLVGPEPNEDTRLPDWVVAAPGLAGDTASRLRGVPGGALLLTAATIWPCLWRLRDEYDVLHVFNSASLFNLLAVPLARLCGKPSVLEMSLRGSDDPLRLRRWRAWSRLPFLRRPPWRYFLFRMGSRFVAKSDALREAFLAAGMDQDRLHQIPYGVDTDKYRPPTEDEKATLRRELGLTTDGVLILFVGGLTPRKGIHWLIEAFRRSMQQDRAHLVLVGPDDKYDPEYSAGLRQSVAESGLIHRVSFVTRMATNVHEYMRACDIFVLPSVREGLPISVLEAMSCGMAVVASDIPEIAHSQIDDGADGCLFPVGEPEALAAALARLVGDPEERERLAAAARLRVDREFSNHVVDSQYLRLYADLLGPRGGSTYHMGWNRSPTGREAQ